MDSKQIDAKWIQKAHLKKGSFTRKAHKHGYKTAAEFKAEVLAHPDKYDTHTIRQANLMNTFQHMHTEMCGHCLEEPATGQCGGKCGKVVYCSQKCANDHYGEHKNECKM